MNSEIAQIVILTAFGNSALNDLLSPSDEKTLRDHSVLTLHIRTIKFHNGEAKTPTKAVTEWMGNLKEENISRLWLVGLHTSSEIDPHIAEAFSNTVQRGIAIDTSGSKVVYVPHWHFGQGQKWIVTYNLYKLPANVVLSKGNVTESLVDLETKIADARGFASRTEKDHWTAVFDDALETIQMRNKMKYQYLPSKGYSEEAKTLMSGAVAAWVFGGMGSWNDIWFKEEALQAEYQQITKELYSSVSEGITIAVNSFNPKP